MKKRLLKAAGIMAGALVAAPLLVGAQYCAVRGGLRFLALEKFFDQPGAWERANMVAERKTPAPPRNGRVVDLGYAKFQVKETGPVSVRLAGKDGTSLLVETANYQILFINPSPPAKLDAEDRHMIENGTDAFPKLTDYMREMAADEVEAAIEMEDARPVKFTGICLMSGDEFLLYKTKMERKAEQRYGWDEVRIFESGGVKGAAQIGEAGGDRKRAFMLIGSRDGWKMVGCRVTAKGATSGDSGEMIEEIAGSFKFTIEDLGDTEEIKRLIAKAGIHERKPDARK